MRLQTSPASGVALVIVLGFLVIISALAVAFFSSVTTELKASRNFASGVTTRQLAESATQVVMGQIRNATVRPNAAWASQPGMIRVYHDGSSASDKAGTFVKLYSSDNMLVTSGDLQSPTQYQQLILNDYALDWNTKPAFWTDLNSPVVVNGQPHFPIIDPRAYARTAPNPYTTVPPDTDPGTPENVEGFWYDAGSAISGIKGPGTPSEQRLPMPVRWIYVLQDGSLTAPAGGAGTKAEWTSNSAAAPKPTKTNPIVGRIAFWTDDETAKVNLNTAGGFVDPDMDPALKTAGYNRVNYAGSYWDTPRFYHEFDRGMPYKESAGQPTAGTPLPGKGGLAICQLLQNEFQRYPGHPGTTSLGLIFGNFLRSEQIYYMLPRFGTTNSTGGTNTSTEGGTKRVIPFNPVTEGAANPNPKNLQIQPKAERLYASVDELVFAADSPSAADANFQRRTTDKFLQSSPTPLVGDAITPALVDRLRFFLTTHSRSPELNLFGRPRVTVWPVRFELSTTADPSGLNAFDNVILFCSTVGTLPTSASRPDTTKAPSTANPVFRYIFTRRELPPTQATADPSGRWILPVPVTAATWTPGKWVPDADQPRNRQLLQYLQALTNTEVPGFANAKTFKDKLGEDNRNNLLAEMFDYILCANSKDTTTKTIDGTSTAKQYAPSGLVMPSKPDYLKGTTKYSGFGRFPTINEASLVFYYAGPVRDATNTNLAKVDAVNGRPTHHRMGAFLLLSTFNPMQGYAPITDPGEKDPKVTYEIDDGLSKFTANWVGATGGPFPLGFRAKDPYNTSLPISTTIHRSSNSTWAGRNLGGYEGFMHTLVGLNTALTPHKIKGGKGNLPLDPGYRVDPGTTRIVTTVGNAEALPKSDSWNSSSAKEIPAFTDSDVMANQEWYQFQTDKLLEIPVNPTGPTTFNFGGGDVIITVKFGGRELQKIKLNFPSSPAGWRVPTGDPTTNPETGGPNGINLLKVRNAANTGDLDLRDVTKWMGVGATTAPTAILEANKWLSAMRSCYWSDQGSFYPDYARQSPIPTNHRLQTSLPASWAFASRLAWSMQQSYNPYANPPNTTLNYYGNRWRQIVQPGDTIRSVVYCDANNGSLKGGKSGDLRLLAVANNATGGFEMHPDYLDPALSRACVLRTATGDLYFPPGAPAPGNVVTPVGSANPARTPATDAPFGNHVLLGATKKFASNRAMGHIANKVTLVNPTINGVYRDDSTSGNLKFGDFDTGTGIFMDGPYINKQDEGNVIYAYQDPVTGVWRYPVPYYDSTWSYEKPGNTFTSPSRQMPSPGMMGSLPRRGYSPTTGSSPAKGWETLCFSPNPASSDHPGNQENQPTELKDHLLLDLFQMPVVEPYPISEPFSTAGKVNLNYQIAPFNYITRSTGLRAALHPLRIVALDADSQYQFYKTGQPATGGTTQQYDAEKNQNAPVSSGTYRYPLDRDKTIRAIDDFFAQSLTNPDKGFFKSATEICERFLYPLNSSPDSDAEMKTWWADRRLSGDNVREKPYVDLLPRITTKSNTYTVHMRVQTLRQRPRASDTDYDEWEEGKDAVLGDYRGSTTIERYIDPGDPRITPNPTTVVGGLNPDNSSLEPLYRFRAVINKKFAP